MRANSRGGVSPRCAGLRCGGRRYTRIQMSATATLADLESALSTVIDPELHRPMLQLGMLRDLSIDGAVASLRVVLTTPACPLKDRIQSDLEQAVIGSVPGITSVS